MPQKAKIHSNNIGAEDTFDWQAAWELYNSIYNAEDVDFGPRGVNMSAGSGGIYYFSGYGGGSSGGGNGGASHSPYTQMPSLRNPGEVAWDNPPDWQLYFRRDFKDLVEYAKSLDLYSKEDIMDLFSQIPLTADKNVTPEEYQHCIARPVEFRFDENGKSVLKKSSFYYLYDEDHTFIINDYNKDTGTWLPVEINGYKIYFFYCVICNPL